MSIEISWPFLIPCLSALLVLVCLGIFIKHHAFHRVLIIMDISATLPAFVPGHGEMKMALPNCALMGVPYGPPKAISLFYIQIYFGLFFLIFHKLNLLKWKSKSG